MQTDHNYRELAERAWSWALRQVHDDDGPWLPDSVPADGGPLSPAADRDSLYSGIAGLAPVLTEIAHLRPLSTVERELSSRVVQRLVAQAPTRVEASLYDGLAGDVTALRMLQSGSEAVSLERLAALQTATGWETAAQLDPTRDAPWSDLVMGTAGIVLAAVWAGGPFTDLIATTGGESLLQAADKTAYGLDWGMQPGWPSRGPNYSHGTAGIATALLVCGVALARPDFIEAAVEGARHLLAVGSLHDDGFVIPHTIPPTTARVVEPLTYTWCAGPTGTSQLFAALAYAGVHEVGGYRVSELRQRCLHSVLTSGVPQRLRPGFWDNDGRCCGTAGVGDVLLDAVQDCRCDPGRAEMLLGAARTMADALVERAVLDSAGARWQFLEHRQDPPLLPPGTSWMQGACGIAAFLFRISRVLQDGPGAPVVDRPDQWWAVPAEVRTMHVR